MVPVVEEVPMQVKLVAAVSLIAVLGACSDAPTAPEPPEASTIPELVDPRLVDPEVLNQVEEGTGLVLESLTGITLPLIGEVGDVVIDEAVITRLILVQDVVGNIVGLEAEGILELTGGVLGTDVVTEDFRTAVLVARSGAGCRLLGVDLGPITLDALGGAVSVDAPAATVNTRSQGIVGGLLCAVSQLLLQPPTNAVTAAVRFLVAIINRILI
jgi:hypothetical protein